MASVVPRAPGNYHLASGPGTVTFRKMNRLLLVALFAAALAPVQAADAAKPAPAAAATKNLLPDDGDAAWKDIVASTTPPVPPAEWNQKEPTKDEYDAFRLKMGESAGVAADKAKEFQARFPKHAHVDDAKELRTEMLKAAVSLGVKSREDELVALVGKGGGAGNSNGGAAPAPSDAFGKRMSEAVTAARKLEGKGMKAMLAEFETQIRSIQKDFPDRPEVYGALLEIAQGIGGENGIAITKEVDASKAPDEFKKMAAGARAEILAEQKKTERVGKPLDLKFTAVDGRAVDVSAMKGKVVLIDFWATWCGPCIGELPNVLAAYERLHPKGFEIVGISFDQEKDTLESFVKKRGMGWAQYFDGEGWGNKFGKEFGIRGIPSMWLIDKKGNLRDLEARDGLTAKVEKLLAEE